MLNYLEMYRKSRKTFPFRKRLKIRLKENPTNPFDSLYIAKFIENKENPEYELYIHAMYFSIKSLNLENFDTLRIPMDKKLWIEIYCAFDFVEIIK